MIQVDSSYAEAHLNLGFLLVDNGQAKRGKSELAIAVQLDPSLADRIPTGLNVTPVPEPTTSTGPQASATPSSSPG